MSMVIKYDFYKTSGGEWFVDIPEWEGDIAELQMVMGADQFLDILSEGDERFAVTLSTEKFTGSDCLFKIREGDLEGPEFGTGAWYILPSYKGISFDHNMWLCDVTKWVFGNFPEEIYFSRINW
jgi:hypothetical protein